jgi:hypothetical protein
MWSLKNEKIQEAIAFKILFNFQNNIQDVDLLFASYNKFIIDKIRTIVKTQDDTTYVANSLGREQISDIELSFLLNIAQVIDTSEIRSKVDSIELLNKVEQNGLIAPLFYLANMANSADELLPLFIAVKKHWVSFTNEEKNYENPFGEKFDNVATTLIQRAESSLITKKWLYVLSAKAILGKEGETQLQYSTGEIFGQIANQEFKPFYKQVMKYINNEK